MQVKNTVVTDPYHFTAINTVSSNMTEQTQPISATALRFVTAGSVDDGKSTLIGRLLYDSKTVLSDHIAAVANSKANRHAATALDLSLLTDGLEAEREQGITIDVAYRYFATPKRKFIVADAPGHEQYTRNMITGASNSDVVVVLVDVTKLDFSQRPLQLLAQTKRHSTLAALIGLKHIVLAVNKMDAVAFAQNKFDAVVAAFTDFAQRSHLPAFEAVPLSALNGDNVVDASSNMPWYSGPPLLGLLENMSLDEQHDANLPARLPVQTVVRAAQERYLLGRLDSGSLSVGASVSLQPSGQTAVIAALYDARGPATQVHAGQSISVVLDRQVDVSRGDWLVTQPAPLLRQFSARLAWLDNDVASTSRKYWLRHGTRWTLAKITRIERKLNLQSLAWDATDSVLANDIAEVSLHTQDALPLELFTDNPRTGAFVLVDAASNRTVAAGMVSAQQLDGASAIAA
jgi:sulfate adenylyltransferase subunit 1